MMNPSFLSVRTVTRDLTVGLVCTVILVMTLIGTSYYVFSLNQITRERDIKTTETVEKMAEVLAFPVWNLDSETIKSIAEAYVHAEDILYLKIDDNRGNVLWETGESHDGGSITETRDITRLSERLGTVSVSMSTQHIRDARRNIFWSTLAALLLVVVAIIVVNQVLLKTFLITPLQMLTDGIDTIANGNYSHRIPLSHRSDIDTIARRVNLMADQIAQRDQQLRELIQTLKQRVEDLDQARTELKNHRDQLELVVAERTAELKRSNVELEQFAYVASHDLQEPLRKVASFTELLGRRYQGRLDEKADMYIQHAMDGAKRMQMFISDLLNYSRVGRVESVFEPTDMGRIVEKILSDLDYSIEKSQVKVTVDSLPTIMANPLNMRQLMQNLISNGLKFVQEKSNAKVHIAATEQQEEWIFSVTDNGIGIHPDEMEKIFGIFQRVRTKRDQPGTGIGLAICKKIVEFHQGRIWVESTQGKGSVFYFSIPKTKDI